MGVSGCMDTAEPKRVIIESPYAGNVKLNVAYAQACLLDSLNRGEAPIASHLLYTQVLNDLVPTERKQGIDAGLAWRKVAEAAALYVDFGVSEGMNLARKLYEREGIPFEQRTLPQNALMLIKLYPNVKAPDYQW